MKYWCDNVRMLELATNSFAWQTGGDIVAYLQGFPSRTQYSSIAHQAVIAGKMPFRQAFYWLLANIGVNLQH